MRIDYELTPKEYLRCYNLAQGIFAERKKIKRNPLRRVRPYSMILLANYLLCLIYIPFIAYFDTLVDLDYLADLFALFMIVLFFLNTLALFISIFFYLKSIKSKKGELRFDENSITDTTENGKQITRNWTEIEFVYVREAAIFLIAKKRLIFIIPKSTGKLDLLLNYLEQRKENVPNLKIMDTIHHYYPEESKLKKHFLNWGVYVLSFLVLFMLAIAWESYNFYLIHREMAYIEQDDFDVDNYIYSYEKFGVVEKELKDFFHTYRTNRNIYIENSASGILYLLDAEYLENNREDLEDLLKELPSMQNKTEKAINKLTQLADQEKMMENLNKLDLGDTYTEIYKEYVFSFANERFKREWSAEIYNNQLRMQYLTRMIEILALPNACWEVEDDHLYFCDEAQLKEYNDLYDLLMENQKEPSNGVKI